MRTIKGKMLMMIFIATFLGCSVRLHKDYAFTELKLKFSIGVIYAKLRGTMVKSSEKLTKTQAPYELLIWFESSSKGDLNDCLITLDEIYLKNLDTGRSIQLTNPMHIQFRKKYDGNFIANYNYENLGLSYVDHELKFRYTFDKNCKLDEKSVIVSKDFKTSYSERKISFWDMLMGV